MARKSKTTTDAFNFESAIQELESLVSDMEQGDISLEDSLKKFERGIELTRKCQAALQQAEQKVQLLVERANGDEITDMIAPEKSN